MQIPAVNLAIVQPSGYLHSLAFIDHARYFRYQFRRLGAPVTITKNRLREDAVNFVFGAHLGFPVEQLRRHACIVVNLEQLGAGGAPVSDDYVRLLRHCAVVDYDAGNVRAYARDPQDVPLVPFMHAPYLDDGKAPPIEDRPIDLLFFGSANDRRRRFIDRIEAGGIQVTAFDRPIYGPERDEYVRHAKAVLNCHFYETSRFEQARAFQCMSLGTPVVSERTPRTDVPPAFEDTVFWIDDRSVESFFRDVFAGDSFPALARSKLGAFRRSDPIDAYADLLAFASGFADGFDVVSPAEPWRPDRIALGAGDAYRPGWLNVDVDAASGPDVVARLDAPLEWPLALRGERGGDVLLEAGSVDCIVAGDVPARTTALPALMDNLLVLLREGGELHVEVPCAHAPAAWHEPGILRGWSEASWEPYVERFWSMGWFTHRFEVVTSNWLDATRKACERPHASFMSVTMRKVETGASERVTARAMSADFGPLPPDDLPSSGAAPETEGADAAGLVAVA
jgi:hypothetical protein